MKIVVAGAGRLGTQLARALDATANDITVIDKSAARLDELARHEGRARRLRGDACDLGVLERAGTRAAELLIAATGDDEDNLVVSLLAKRQLAVPRVLARVNDPDNEWLFDNRWGVDVALPAAAPIISLIQEATGVTGTVALARLASAGVDIIETTISPDSPLVGRAVADLPLPTGCVVAAAIRTGRPSVPDANWQLEPGDELLVIAEPTARSALQGIFP